MSVAPKSSPWGPVQWEKEIAPGIVCVSTASHGGIWLNGPRQREFWKKIPNAQLFTGTRCWFEEDCDAGLVVIAFPDLFRWSDVQTAIRCCAASYSGNAEAVREYVERVMPQFADELPERPHSKLGVESAVRGNVTNTPDGWDAAPGL